MDVIKTGIGITKTIKNVSRFREILTVFAKNGFDELILQTGLHSRIPNFVLSKSKVEQLLQESSKGNEGEGPFIKNLGLRLRKSFEELGPTFIKLGQILSTREDIFDQSFILEMKKLLDQAPGIDFTSAQMVMERSLKRPLSEVFKEIIKEPIGKASIGVVYKGELFSGEKVVIKIRRPEIEKIINTDISILLFITEKLEHSSKELRYLGLSRIIRDFATTIKRELDFNIELLNCERLRESIGKIDLSNTFYFPQMFKEYSSEEMLVMEFLDGIPFSRTTEIRPYKPQLEETFLKGIHVFTDSLLVDGFFHADLHGGNFFLLKNGQIGIIDFGLVGTLGKKGRRNLVAILYFLLTFNYENLVYEFLDVADYEKIPDVDLLCSDIRDCLSPYVGLTSKQLNFGNITSSVIKTLTHHEIYLPREWFTIFRALVTLDGVGRSLEFDFDLFHLMDNNLKNSYSKMIAPEEILEEGIWASRDLLATAKTLPHHLKWFLKDFAKKGYAFQVKNTGHENELKFLSTALLFIGHALFSCVLIIAGFLIIFAQKKEISSYQDISFFSYLVWVLGLFIFFRANGMTKKFRK